MKLDLSREELIALVQRGIQAAWTETKRQPIPQVEWLTHTPGEEPEFHLYLNEQQHTPKEGPLPVGQPDLHQR